MLELPPLRYRGYSTRVLVDGAVSDFLLAKGIDMQHKLDTQWCWDFYEENIFELLDEDDDGLPDSKFGRQFTLTFYAVVDRSGGYVLAGGQKSESSAQNIKDGIMSVTGSDGRPYGVRYRVSLG